MGHLRQLRASAAATQDGVKKGICGREAAAAFFIARSLCARRSNTHVAAPVCVSACCCTAHPGTDKTLLAKAVLAHETHANFFLALPIAELVRSELLLSEL